MSALAKRDALVKQLRAARAAINTASRELSLLLQEIDQNETAQRRAHENASRYPDEKDSPAEIAARLQALRDREPEARQALAGAERAQANVNRELRALYRQESATFAEEAEAATQEFVARRDEVIDDLRRLVGDLTALDRQAADLWRPLCLARDVEGPRRTAAWEIAALLPALAGAAPRSRAFTPEGEETPEPAPAAVPDGPVWLLTDDGLWFCETPGSEAYKHLIKNRGAVIADGPEEAAA